MAFPEKTRVWPNWRSKLAGGLLVLSLGAGTCVAQVKSTKTQTSGGTAKSGAAGDSTQQNKAVGTSAASAELMNYFQKHPGLLEEFSRLIQKLQKDVQYPTGRTESNLLPLVPAGTIAYAAMPNYADSAHQALDIFKQELKDSKPLQDWWQEGELAKNGPKILRMIENFSQIQECVGNEIVLSVTMTEKEPSVVAFAQIKKPGLKKLMEQGITQTLQDNPQTVIHAHIYEPQDLAALKKEPPKDDLIVLVRPDYVMAGGNLTAVKNFSARLDRPAAEFASTPFGKRVAEEYKGGVTVLAAADLQRAIREARKGNEKDQAGFQQSGFADMKYLVWDRKELGDQTLSQVELSFAGPRHGAAAWLAKPSPLGSLDFVSPKAMMALSLKLVGPGQIFDDIKDMAGPSSANQFAAIENGQKALNLNLKDDLLNLLTGEITLELDDVSQSTPKWRAFLGVNDAAHLQKTMGQLMALTQMKPTQDVEGGVTYNTLLIPNGKKATEIGFAFADGYLVIGSGRDATAEAVRAHKSGESLAKSKRFLDALPTGKSTEASMMIYQDPVGLASLQLRQSFGDLADSLGKLTGTMTPGVMSFYGEDTAIREISRGGQLDVGVMLVTAAVAIPNLLKSRQAANEASAVGSVRTLNTAQVTYSTLYPGRGFAIDLAHLGPNPKGGRPSDLRADLLDASLGADTCTATAWCTKSGYQFRVRGICLQGICKQYVALATPVDANTGTRSFCSTADGVIRYKQGPPLTTGLTVAECKAWAVLK
jgi:type II secretory pathway pseudopilin PulG